MFWIVFGRQISFACARTPLTTVHFRKQRRRSGPDGKFTMMDGHDFNHPGPTVMADAVG